MQAWMIPSLFREALCNTGQSPPCVPKLSIEIPPEFFFWNGAANSKKEQADEYRQGFTHFEHWLVSFPA